VRAAETEVEVPGLYVCTVPLDAVEFVAELGVLALLFEG
jgi:hypothetical protein